jgi:hypothetical protein
MFQHERTVALLSGDLIPRPWARFDFTLCGAT